MAIGVLVERLTVVSGLTAVVLVLRAVRHRVVGRLVLRVRKPQAPICFSLKGKNNRRLRGGVVPRLVAARLFTLVV